MLFFSEFLGYEVEGYRVLVCEVFGGFLFFYVSVIEGRYLRGLNDGFKFGFFIFFSIVRF